MIPHCVWGATALMETSRVSSIKGIKKKSRVSTGREHSYLSIFPSELFSRFMSFF